MSASDPLPSETAPVVDAGNPNSPGAVDPDHIVWTKSVPKKWCRNAHEKASTPLAFSNATGRFSDPKLPFDTLYLGSDTITCFWESGTGRNLTKRFLSDRTIAEDDLRSRIEYTVTLDPDLLQIFDADDSRARRSIGALSSACFLADHAVSQLWAAALFGAGATVFCILQRGLRMVFAWLYLKLFLAAPGEVHFELSVRLKRSAVPSTTRSYSRAFSKSEFVFCRVFGDARPQFWRRVIC
jgi:hypothetical protein